MDIKIDIDGKILKAKKECLLSEVLSLHTETEMPCGGHGKCGKCRVLASGNISEPSENERALLGEEAINCGVRLACLTRATGDCAIITSKSSESRILTDGYTPDFQVIPTFSKYGVAIDIGTTTLAARLFDVGGNGLSDASMSNPQSRFGADVISRMESALKGNAEAISEITVKAIDDLIVELCDAAGIESFEIDGIVITGNTVMLHLLTMTDVFPLTRAPFETKRLFNEVISAEELSLRSVKHDVEVYFPACIAAFIGADTTCAMLAASLSGSKENELLCDIGTNGEIVLSTGGKLFACSTAAGPAFEGAGISMGMAGKIGAIDHVTLVNGLLYAHVIGEVKPIGICGSGIIDAISCLLMTEELDESGRLDDGDAVISDGVVLTQEDIRKIQLAKSAIHAGIRTLLHSSDTNISKISSLIIAGGFGSYLDSRSAVNIGLLPYELKDKIRVIGNAALSGASMLLLNRTLREKTAELVREVTVTELSGNPLFADEYMERMMFE